MQYAPIATLRNTGATPPVPAYGAPAAPVVAAKPIINTAQFVGAQANFARTAQKQSTESPWGGGCPWQYDKTAFKKWLKEAMDRPTSNERKELYGYLCECFLDADGDRDGLIAYEEFDFLVEKAAAMPRRFGLAPSWVECYGGVPQRQQARTEMFQQMDKMKRGKIGMDEWCAFTMQHIGEKVRQIDWQTMDFCHLEAAGPEQFLTFLATALADRSSEQYKSLYEFLFKTFVESDTGECGAITKDRFDILLEEAAQAPRALGLAPPTNETYSNDAQKRQARDAMFDQMDVDRSGNVTFDKFLNWAVSHIAVKVNEAMTAKYGRIKQTEAKTSPWGGGCPWQYDKSAFKSWLQKAIENPAGKDRKELYGYLCECFLDADGDRDGLIAYEEFDFLVEKAAAMPRRFGLAPSWIECYGGVPQRQQARTQMFQQMDRAKRGKIGMEEWVSFSIAHITEKVRGIDWTTLDFAHLDRSGPAPFVKFLERGLSDKSSEEYKALYEHLFKTFVESDAEEKGAISFAQFDILIEDAAQAPRALGLAPSTEQAYPTAGHKQSARQQMFNQMDTNNSGTITFDKFLTWAMNHIGLKVNEYRSGGGR